MRILRVNADDFAYTEGVTDGIICAHRNGIVTHTSIMPGGLDFDRAIQIAKDTPSIRLGVHLTLTWGYPCLSRSEIGSLVREDGTFYNLSQFIRQFLLGKISMVEVYNELFAQINKVKGKGINPTHLDSHHHIHMLPGIFHLLIRLANDYNIKWIRRPIDLSFNADLTLTNLLKQVILGCLSIRKWPVQTSDTFRGLSIQGNHDFVTALKNIINHLPTGVTELMVHPAIPDNELRNQDPFVREREYEMEALCDAGLKNDLDRAGITLGYSINL